MIFPTLLVTLRSTKGRFRTWIRINVKRDPSSYNLRDADTQHQGALDDLGKTRLSRRRTI
jgi:hypothetical protein